MVMGNPWEILKRKHDEMIQYILVNTNPVHALLCFAMAIYKAAFSIFFWWVNSGVCQANVENMVVRPSYFTMGIPVLIRRFLCIETSPSMSQTDGLIKQRSYIDPKNYNLWRKFHENVDMFVSVLLHAYLRGVIVVAELFNVWPSRACIRLDLSPSTGRIRNWSL